MWSRPTLAALAAVGAAVCATVAGATVAGAMLSACATLADTGGGDSNMPNASAGPFREIEVVELGNSRTAPYGLKDNDEFPHDMTVVHADAELSSLEVWGYVTQTVFAEDVEPDPLARPTEIARYVALDGRSFARQFTSVLMPSEAWEGDVLRAPSALRVGGEVWLYYAAAGGIGLAKSADGVSFARVGDGPVLSPADGWERSAVPTSPAVVLLPDGNFHMFYVVARSPDVSDIGEARSTDGVSWQRVGQGPALSPQGPSPNPVYPLPDALSVGGPCAVISNSSLERDVEWLYYAGTNDNGKRTIALAARYDFDGPFSRATSPVFGSADDLDPREPWVMRFADFTLLYATQRAGSTSALDFPAVAVGVAPADLTLPAPR
jgi:hypothetical protein